MLRALLAEVWAAPAARAIFVAEIAGEMAGFVRISLTDHGPCPARIDTLYVDRRFRGRGAGSLLLERAYAWFRERDANEVAVEFIAPNDLARGFYEDAGFQPFLVTHIRRL